MASMGQVKPATVTHPAMERLLRILDGMADGISIVNRQDEIEYANAALEREFGPARGRSRSEYFENLPSSSARVAGERTHEKQFCRADWQSRKNGRNYELLTIPFLGSDGQLARLQIFQGITQRRLAEKVLRETDLFFAIDKISRGNIYIARCLADESRRELVQFHMGKRKLPSSEPLTTRERESLRLIAEGKSSRQIGELLIISAHTVERHRANIMEKLSVSETKPETRTAAPMVTANS